MTKGKVIGILAVLIIVAGVGMFFFGQEVLAQEVVVAELNMSVSPIASSPLSDISVSVEAKAYRSRVSVSAMRRGYDVAEVSEDKIAGYGATVEFQKNVTIYNATGHMVFQNVLSFTKGADRKFTIYLPPEEAKQGSELTIVVDIKIKLTLPTPQGAPSVPNVITRTIHKEMHATVQGS